MGRRNRRGRDVHGVLLLDKPRGLSSNDALQRVKRLFDAKKAGHTGSLDRLASGMLPICFGEGTKLSGYLLNADKAYRTRMRLGQTTTTSDEEGEVTDTRPVPMIANPALEALLGEFRGAIEQIPPMFSALKRNGRRLYELAHQGLEVEREARPVTIHHLHVMALEPEAIELDVRCSKGTYIRTLVADIGERLGCGAHVSWLRRYEAGPFREAQMMSFETLEACRESAGIEALAQFLRPLEEALPDWPRVTLNADSEYYVRRGQAVLVPHSPTVGWVRIEGTGGHLIGVGEVLGDGRIAPRRLIKPSATQALSEEGI